MVRSAYFDDLDPECLVGNIHIRASGFSKLWDLCDAESLRVIADIHTHPSTAVAQSSTDRGEPYDRQRGASCAYRATLRYSSSPKQERSEFMSIAGTVAGHHGLAQGQNAFSVSYKEQVNGHY